MASDPENTKLQAESGGDKEDVIASVRLKADAEKLIRRAAVELDMTRSDFMAEASEQSARKVMDRIALTQQQAS